MERTYENKELQTSAFGYTFTQEGIYLQNAVEKAKLIQYADIKSMYLSMADTETEEVKSAIERERLATADGKDATKNGQSQKYAWINLLSIPKFHVAKLNMTNKIVSEYLANEVLGGFLFHKEAFDELLAHCLDHIAITSSVYRMYQVELDESFVKNQVPFTKRSILQEAQWKPKKKQ